MGIAKVGFAVTHLLEGRYDIRTIEELSGHRDVRTTMIYTHATNRGGRGMCRPFGGRLRPCTILVRFGSELLEGGGS